MLPTLEGVIARRVLVNFRIDPDVARRLVPAPLEPVVERGACVAGICLIRLERLRPKGLPAAVGLASENMAHRIAIRYPTPDGPSDGVFIWRRDTDQALVSLLGGRLFPGVHGKAAFDVRETGASLRMSVRTERDEADVALSVRAAFYADAARFPAGSAVLDGAVLMRGIPHEWHELVDVPELATPA